MKRTFGAVLSLSGIVVAFCAWVPVYSLAMTIIEPSHGHDPCALKTLCFFIICICFGTVAPIISIYFGIQDLIDHD